MATVVQSAVTGKPGVSGQLLSPRPSIIGETDGHTGQRKRKRKRLRLRLRLRLQLPDGLSPRPTLSRSEVKVPIGQHDLSE